MAKAQGERAKGVLQVGPYEVAIELLIRKGESPEYTSYAVRHTEGQGIPEAVLRDLDRQRPQMADYLYATAKATVHENVDLAGAQLKLSTKAGKSVTADLAGGRLTGQDVDPDRQNEMLDELARRRRRRFITPELLTEVVQVYRAADPARPNEAVMDHFKVPKATASRWIKRAKDEGFFG